MDLLGVPHDIDGIDEVVGHCGQRAVTVLLSVSFANSGHRVAEAGPLEVPCIRVDHCVREEVAAGVVDPVGPLAHSRMHVGVDLGVTSLADLLDRPGHVRRREVVEQHPVGELAAQRQHLLVEGTEYQLRRTLTESHPEAESRDLIEVALERDALATQALAHEREVFANLRERAGGVFDAVPLRGDDG